MNIETHNIRWALLCTGWGRSACHVLDAFANGSFQSSVISIVIYENEPCGAAERAREIGVPILQLKRSSFESGLAYQMNMVDILREHAIDYIFLLSYKYIVRKRWLQAFPDRIVNIHPSLLPSFKGTMTAIQDAMAYGVTISGITTHFIDDKVDEGTIIDQYPVRFEADDTFETLDQKFNQGGKILVTRTIQQVEKQHQS